MLGNYIVAVCGIVALNAIIAHCDCIIDLSSADFPKPRTPIFLEGNQQLHLIIPDKNLRKTIISGGQIVLACPGVLRSKKTVKPKNEFSGMKDRTIVRLKCVGQEFWDEVDNVKRNLKTLTCLDEVNAEVSSTQNSCASQMGKIFQVGFRIETNFYSSFEVCYNYDSATTYYATHTVHPAANKAKDGDKSVTFRSDMTGLIMATFIKIYKNAYEAFNKIMPNQKYITDKNKNAIIARGHLVPDADFTFKYRRDATLFYINAGPEFQSINCGHWKSVEGWVRKIAELWDTELLIHSGYIGVLQLKDQFGKLKEIYLHNDANKRFPIPEFFFKIVQHTDSESAIVFVTYNNPFATEHDIPSNMCTDVCPAANIVHTTFYRNRDTNLHLGYTRCCTLDDFALMYPAQLPANVRAIQLLVNSTYPPQPYPAPA